MSHRQHLTTRRVFITTLGFGGVALYGAWAAYGAAPFPSSVPPAKTPEARRLKSKRQATAGTVPQAR